MAKKLSGTLEDYLAVILKFEREKRFARVSDIASTLGVAKSAVTAALQRLSARGLLNYQPYEPVTLTTEGAEQAEEVILRHRVILDFLQHVLALEPERAEAIACEMEHVIDRPALERFACFLAFIGLQQTSGESWLEAFQDFTERGGHGDGCKTCIKTYIDQIREDMAPA